MGLQRNGANANEWAKYKESWGITKKVKINFRIFVFIDEMADLMTAGKEVEYYVQRLAQWLEHMAFI